MSPRDLVEAIWDDQRRRVLAGEAIRAEDYLDCFPSLRDQAECVVDVIYGEFAVRVGAGESLDMEELLRRFPEYREQLERQFCIRAALDSEALKSSFHGKKTADSSSLGATDASVTSTVGIELPEQGPPTTLAPALAPDRFEVLEEIGRGAMGVVYKAQQKGLNRLVALKMILAGAHAGEELLARFQTEAEAVAKLQHPNIVQIYEIGQHDDRPYFALEYVPGGTLRERLAGTPLPSREAAELIEQLARAADYAHEHGVVHRDLKPANILLEEAPEQASTSRTSAGSSSPTGQSTGTIAPAPRAKITDFGLAKQTEVDSGQTRSDAVIGTPSYMAPEQAAGHAKEVGPLADVYALGAILYEALTGRPPFKSATLVETLQQVQLQEPIPPRRFQAAIPRDLETVCLKCLEKHAAKRYASAGGLADDLQRFLEGVPITARPVSKAEQLWRWARRNSAIAASLVVIVLLLLATTIGSIIAARSFRTLAGEKEQESIAALKAQGLAEQREKEAQAARQKAQELAESNEQRAYTSEMLAASGFANQHNGIGRVAEIVDRWVPAAGEVDRRGWEWYYMKSLAHRQLAKLAERKDAVEIAWGPYSKAVLTVSPDGRIESHDVASGRVKELVRSSERIQSAGWSKDRKLVAAACADGKLRVWDAASARLLADLELGEGHSMDTAWHPNGRWLAATTDRDKVTVWDWHKREIVLRSDVRANAPGKISWHPQKPLLAAREGLHVFIVDVTTGRVQCELHSGAARCLCWNPDGRRIAIASTTETAIWDTERREVATRLKGRFSFISELAWNPRGDQLAASDQDRTVRIWNADTGDVLRVVRGHPHQVSDVAWSPNGRFLVSNGWFGGIRVWDACQGTDDLIRPLESGCCRWLPRADLLAVASGQSLEVLNATTGRPEESWAVESPIHTFAFDSTGEHVAYRGRNGRVWISNRGQSSARLVLDEGKKDQLITDPRPRQSIVWSPDNSLLAAVTSENQLAIWNATTGVLVATPRQLPKRVLTLAWSPEGRTLAYGSDDGELAWWDVKSQCELGSTKPCGTVVDICWRPNGTEFLVAGSQRIHVVDTKSGRIIQRLVGPASDTKSVTATGDGSRIATVCRDGVISIWGGRTGEILASFQVHPTEPYWVRWNADETRLASLARNDAVRVCDAQTGLEQAGDPRALARLTRRLEEGSASSRQIQVFHKIVAQLSRQDEVIAALETAHNRSPKSRQVTMVLVDLLCGRAGLHRSKGRLEEAEKDHARAKALREASPPPPAADAPAPLGVTPLELVRTLEGHECTVGAIDISPDGRLAVSASSDRTLRLWDLQTGDTLHVLPIGNIPYGIDISPDGRLVAVAGLGSCVRIWNLETCKVHRDVGGGSGGRIPSLCFSPDSRFLLATCADGTVLYWDVESGAVIHSFPVSTEFKYQTGTKISGDGRLGVVFPELRDPNAPIVHVLDLHEGKLLRQLRIPGGHPCAGYCALSNDASTLLIPVAEPSYGNVAVCDLTLGTTRRVFGHRVRHVAFLPDNQHAVCSEGADDGLVSVWDTVTGQLVAASGKLKYPIVGLAVTPDGNTILAGHAWFSRMPAPNPQTLKEDFAIRVWRLPESVWSKAKPTVAPEPADEGEPAAERTAPAAKGPKTEPKP